MTTITHIEACVFDAYGTLFDFNTAARAARDELGDDWQPLSDLWRQKQLQYTWLRGLGEHYADFWQVTGDALDFALATLKLNRPGLRKRLMDLYLELDCYPEVAPVLDTLKAAGLRLAILSNGSMPMLSAVVRRNGLQHVFDAVLSVEEVRTFKPHPLGVPTRTVTAWHRAGAHLLSLLQCLGRLLRQGFRFSGVVVQPFRPAAGRHPGHAGCADRDPCGPPPAIGAAGVLEISGL